MKNDDGDGDDKGRRKAEAAWRRRKGMTTLMAPPVQEVAGEGQVSQSEVEEGEQYRNSLTRHFEEVQQQQGCKAHKAHNPKKTNKK